MQARSQVARLLQVVLLAHVVGAAGWLAWRLPQSPGQAMVGAILILGIGPLVLAAEFLLLSVLARSDPAPRARPLQLLRAWITESLHLYAKFGWRQPFRWRVVPDHLPADAQGRTGAVLVHGFLCNRGFWNAWLQRLRAEDIPCIAVNLEPPFGAIDGYAPAIDVAVARLTDLTGCPPVLVCHSMGGLAARAWWRSSGGRRKVQRIVTIASPHQGTWAGRFSRRANGMQMRLQSDWLRQLLDDERHHPLPALTCWYSNCDNIVLPPSTARHPAADNRFLGGEPHVALAFHAQVVEETLDLLRPARPLSR